MSKCALSTIDNPFNPFTQYNDWYRFDHDYGYCSSELVARIARFSNELSDEQNDEEEERAINEIIKNDFTNLFIKVANPNSNQSSNENT